LAKSSNHCLQALQQGLCRSRWSNEICPKFD
jgi:hypothetical protein